MTKYVADKSIGVLIPGIMKAGEKIFNKNYHESV